MWIFFLLAQVKDPSSSAPPSARPGVTVVPSEASLDASETAAASAHPAVFVHLATPSPVSLEIQSDDPRQPFAEICASPCDTYVPGEGRYRIAGPGVRPSTVFSLSPQTNAALAVHPSSQIAFGGGIALGAVGAAAVGIGLWWQLGASFADPPAQGSAAPRYGLIVGGLVAGIAGACLAGRNGRTDVAPIVVPAPSGGHSGASASWRESPVSALAPAPWTIPVGFSW